jgi:hypothetical protein
MCDLRTVRPVGISVETVTGIQRVSVCLLRDILFAGNKGMVVQCQGPFPRSNQINEGHLLCPLWMWLQHGNHITV